MRRLALVPLSLLVLLSQATALAAEPATPVASPTARECTVSPRTLDELLALKANRATPEAIVIEPATPTAFAMPEGKPADAATVAGFQETIRLLVACLNEGEYWRMFALYSDRYVESVLNQLGVLDQAAYDALAVPRPVPTERMMSIVEFGAVVVLPDGRIAGVVTTETPGNNVPTTPTLFTLVYNGERWQVDEFLPVPAKP
jgi:hypothetical protein